MKHKRVPKIFLSLFAFILILNLGLLVYHRIDRSRIFRIQGSVANHSLLTPPGTTEGTLEAIPLVVRQGGGNLQVELSVLAFRGGAEVVILDEAGRNTITVSSNGLTEVPLEGGVYTLELRVNLGYPSSMVCRIDGGRSIRVTAELPADRFSLVRAPSLDHDYLLYTPPTPRPGASLIVSGNNTGFPSPNPAVHRDSAKNQILALSRTLGSLNCPILMPVFPRTEENYAHALSRASLDTVDSNGRRIDEQLIAMIRHAQATLRVGGIEVDNQIILSGFSASGMFANRLLFLHPEMVRAAVIGSPGGWPLAPAEQIGTEPLTYPAGIADLTDLTGTPLAWENLRRIPLFFFLGGDDENDAVPFRDSFSAAQEEVIFAHFGPTPVARWEKARDLYRGAGLNALFRFYPGVGHTISPETQEEILTFIEDLLE